MFKWPSCCVENFTCQFNNLDQIGLIGIEIIDRMGIIVHIEFTKKVTDSNEPIYFIKLEYIGSDHLKLDCMFRWNWNTNNKFIVKWTCLFTWK